MKYFKICFLFFLSVAMISCGDETCDNLSETVVGTWTSASLGTGDIEFEADGTLIDANDLLISAEINGEVLDQKSWTVSGNNLMTIRAEGAGSQFLEAELNVPSFDCDLVTLEQLGIMVNLTRK